MVGLGPVMPASVDNVADNVAGDVVVIAVAKARVTSRTTGHAPLLDPVAETL